MSPNHGSVTLSPAVLQTLGRTSAEVHQGLTQGTKFLLALSAKATRTGSPVYAGISPAERARRRAKGRVAKASRKANRS